MNAFYFIVLCLGVIVAGTCVGALIIAYNNECPKCKLAESVLIQFIAIWALWIPTCGKWVKRDVRAFRTSSPKTAKMLFRLIISPIGSIWRYATLLPLALQEWAYDRYVNSKQKDSKITIKNYQDVRPTVFIPAIPQKSLSRSAKYLRLTKGHLRSVQKELNKANEEVA